MKLDPTVSRTEYRAGISVGRVLLIPRKHSVTGREPGHIPNAIYGEGLVFLNEKTPV